jgi:hypothetical protein
MDLICRVFLKSPFSERHRCPSIDLVIPAASFVLSFLPAHSIFDGWLLSDGRRHPRGLLRGMENLTVGRYYGIFVMLFFMENTTLSRL